MKPLCNAIEKPVQHRALLKAQSSKLKVWGFLLFLLYTLHSTLCTSPAATVWGNLLDLHLNALSTPLTWYPTNLVTVTSGGGGGLSAGPAFTIYPTNGIFTNVIDAGDFRVCLPLNNWRNCFTLSVPPGAGTYNITNLLSQKILADGGGGAILANP